MISVGLLSCGGMATRDYLQLQCEGAGPLGWRHGGVRAVDERAQGCKVGERAQRGRSSRAKRFSPRVPSVGVVLCGGELAPEIADETRRCLLPLTEPWASHVSFIVHRVSATSVA